MPHFATFIDLDLGLESRGESKGKHLGFLFTRTLADQDEILRGVEPFWFEHPDTSFA